MSGQNSLYGWLDLWELGLSVAAYAIPILWLPQWYLPREGFPIFHIAQMLVSSAGCYNNIATLVTLMILAIDAVGVAGQYMLYTGLYVNPLLDTPTDSTLKEMVKLCFFSGLLGVTLGRIVTKYTVVHAIMQSERLRFRKPVKKKENPKPERIVVYSPAQANPPPPPPAPAYNYYPYNAPAPAPAPPPPVMPSPQPRGYMPYF